MGVFLSEGVFLTGYALIHPRMSLVFAFVGSAGPELLHPGSDQGYSQLVPEIWTWDLRFCVGEELQSNQVHIFAVANISVQNCTSKFVRADGAHKDPGKWLHIRRYLNGDDTM